MNTRMVVASLVMIATVVLILGVIIKFPTIEPEPAILDLTLPDVPPLLPTKIAIESFTNCETLSEMFTNELAIMYQGGNPQISVIQQPGAQSTSEADLIVSGICNNDILTISLRVSENRGAPEARLRAIQIFKRRNS